MRPFGFFYVLEILGVFFLFRFDRIVKIEKKQKISEKIVTYSLRKIRNCGILFLF